MQTYRCICGNRLFFENTVCLVCQSEVGWCEGCSRLSALEPVGEAPIAPSGAPAVYRCTHADCMRLLHKCGNYAVENICNRCYVFESESEPAQGPEEQVQEHAPGLCQACELTETIPDLSIRGNREKWARLEAAKRRLLFTLGRLGLPYRNAQPKLTFDFKADVEHAGDEWRDAGPAEVVYTGHANGKITINIREADDVEREKLRVQFHEAQRTLIGHFHHEVGHYYWQLLVENRREKEFKKLFGDHTVPTYQDAMSVYYQNGPQPAWNQSYISAYASAHPWEDFAETFALYLDMISVLDTASHLFRSIRANVCSRSVTPLVERFQEAGILVNEFNRTVGLIDLVPEVIVDPVIAKLQYIHSLVKGAARKPRVQAAAKPTTSLQPGLMQQQNLTLFEPLALINRSPDASTIKV